MTSSYDSWKCSGADYPGDDQREHDPNEREDEYDMSDNTVDKVQGEDVQAAILTIKYASARELRMLTAAVSNRRDQLERELKAELSELGNVDKAPRSPNKAPRSDKGKPRAKALADEVQP